VRFVSSQALRHELVNPTGILDLAGCFINCFHAQLHSACRFVRTRTGSSFALLHVFLVDIISAAGSLSEPYFLRCTRWHVFLCAFQSFFWHSLPQYIAFWHPVQRLRDSSSMLSLRPHLAHASSGGTSFSSRDLPGLNMRLVCLRISSNLGFTLRTY
jgi:hypothetical protein